MHINQEFQIVYFTLQNKLINYSLEEIDNECLIVPYQEDVLKIKIKIQESEFKNIKRGKLSRDKIH